LLQLMESAKSGLPRIARIEGEAGIGKSRLVAELAQVAAEQGFRVTSGYCLSTGRTLTYLPWHSIVTSLLGFTIDGNVPESISWLSGFVEKIDPEWLARLPLLGEVLDLPIPDTSMTGTLDGLTRRQATFALVTDLVLHLARKQPVLVILEDAHWIDEVSEALAVDLARRLSLDPAPVLFVLVHRDLSEVDHPPTLIRAIDALLLHTRLVVGELSRTDMSLMVETYLHARIPPELSRFIFERAHGNPFFVQEVVDTLVETGYIRHVGNLTVIEKELESANLPQTVQGLVLARVDRLNEMDKLVLKVASVIGREFQLRVVSNSLPVKMEADELRSRLQTLVEREFIRLESGEPELKYRFKHAIIQEVTYASLLPAQRRQLHHAVAVAVEAIEPDAIEQLAYHFNRSGTGERARHYSILAGQKAFREYANQAALSYFTQAMAQANSDQERFDINRQRLLVMARLGDTKLMGSELPVMQEQATRSNRVDWQAIIYVLQATYYAQTSAWPRVIDAAQRGAALARQIGNDTLAWDAYQLLYNAFVGINQPEEAEGVCRIMQPITENLGDPRRSIQLALMEIDGLYNQEPGQAIQIGGADRTRADQQEMSNALRLAAMHGAKDALEQARELDDPVLEASCLGALTRFHTRRNDLPAALETANQQLALFRQIGDRRLEGLTLNQIGSILVNLGQISDANAHLLDGYKILRQIGERAGEAISFVNLGLIATHYKAYDEALAYLQRGVAVQRELNAEADTAQTLFHMGNVYIVQEHYDEAIKALDEARALFLASNLPQQIDEVYTALAEIHVRRGDLVAARAHIGPLLVRLRARGSDDLFMPGLAYWRCIQILEKCGETEPATQLRAAFRQQADAIRARLPDDQWRKNFVDNLWYHAALLNS
jgi:predicted ATPase